MENILLFYRTHSIEFLGRIRRHSVSFVSQLMDRDERSNRGVVVGVGLRMKLEAGYDGGSPDARPYA